ncbi:MAG: YicC/YloC family endoribonuclease [Bryobacter sp.]|nr:YicC/YloC family endoribonuclease [Bryobacter sp.]
MSLRSMTGFARRRFSRPGPEFPGEITISIKSVNHRSLDLHFHMSSLFDPLENAMRDAVKQQANRGHIDIRVQFARQGAGASLEVNRDLLRAYRGLFEELAAEFGPMGQPDLNVALSLPGAMAEAREQDLPADFQTDLLRLLEETLAEWNTQRDREGLALVAQLLDYNTTIRQHAQTIRSLRSGILPALKDRIQTKIAELLGGANLDPARLAQEAAFLADRGDIEEEITRLLTHCQQMEKLLRGAGETGKKIDFLLQEMNREANTILSKANNSGGAGLEITELGLSVKSHIERIREQSLNLE